MTIKFGPAGLGPVKEAEKNLEKYHKLGFRACEIAFTYSVYIKPADAVIIGKKAKELDIELSIHAPYFVNLASNEKLKVEATKQRIIKCCEIGEMLGAKTVVFHPGYYSDDKQKAYEQIKKGIIEIMRFIKEKGWKIKIAPETMGKINVFGSIDEISRLVEETKCSFCIDFAHIEARDKKIDFEKVKKLFGKYKEWHCHFSGIEYSDKGERRHIKTGKDKWKEVLKNIPKNKNIVIINESPDHIKDSVEGLKMFGG